ncbi:MAG: hypothetical protein Q4P06_07570 [Actinomycetaceae bacterium]|nr:hypothetical protein [Actinomycetaceae bacterium]
MSDQPKRIPIAERLAELNQKPQAKPPLDSYQAGAQNSAPAAAAEVEVTMVPQISPAQINRETHRALTVTQAGRLDATDAIAPIDVGAIAFEDAPALDVEENADNHILVVGTDVDSRELEALALSIWEDAAWVGAGQLRLTRQAHLRGPYRLAGEDRRKLQTPHHLEQAWVVEVPPQRGGPAPEFFMSTDPVAAAFPDGMPAGLELEVINCLQRIARRLAGAVRTAPSGKLIEPDADSAVNMIVYAPRWVEETDLAQLLRPYLPDVVNSQQSHRLVPIDSAQRVQDREELARQMGIPEDEWERIAAATRAADEKALQGQITLSGYSLLASAGNTSRIHCTVQRAEKLPAALRYENWPSQAVVEYSFTWIPPQVYLSKLNKPGRAIRMERMRVKDQIEHLAGLVARSTAGFIVDEDQFLVALQ